MSCSVIFCNWLLISPKVLINPYTKAGGVGHSTDDNFPANRWIKTVCFQGQLWLEGLRILADNAIKVCSIVLDGNSLPCCKLLLFLAIWFRALQHPVQDQVSGGAFFSCVVYTQGLIPFSFAAVSVVRRYFPTGLESWTFVLFWWPFQNTRLQAMTNRILW